MQKNPDFIGTDPIGKLLFRFSLPAMASAFVNCLYNIVDRLYIARIDAAGTDVMAGLALTFPYMIILASFGMMIGLGSGAIVSILLGEKRQEDANKVLGQAFAMFLLFIFTFQALGLILLDKSLIWFGGTPSAIPYARDYLQIILWGNIFQHISFGGSNIVRAEGSSMQAMGIVILGACLNIMLDPLFIFTFKMGIKGAAWATILSMMISSAWVILHFCKGTILRLHLRHIRIYPRLFVRVIAIGLAPCLMQILHSIVVIVYNHSMRIFAADNYEATLGIAAFGIVNPILMMMLMPCFGINMGVQPIFGYNTGARLYDRVHQAVTLSVKLSTMICFLLAAIMYFCAPLFTRCFTPGEEQLLKVTNYALRIATLGFGFIGVGILAGTYYQSVGRATVSIIISTMRQGVILLPLLAILPRYWGFDAIWWAGPIGDVSCGVTCFILFWLECRRLRRLAAGSPGGMP